MATMVISGSAKDQQAVTRWVDHWAGSGYTVIDWPSTIDPDRLRVDYPDVLRNFYRRLGTCDVLFVMNEDRDGVRGYVGPATFAELAYVVARNAIGERPAKIIVLQPVGDDVRGADEIALWHDLGWIHYHRGSPTASATTST